MHECQPDANGFRCETHGYPLYPLRGMCHIGIEQSSGTCSGCGRPTHGSLITKTDDPDTLAGRREMVQATLP